jgi:hypothetical protein
MFAYNMLGLYNVLLPMQGKSYLLEIKMLTHFGLTH